MKPAKPRKRPVPKVPQRVADSKHPVARARPSYPPDVLSDDADVEFLRSIADICNARADEVEQAKAAERNAK
jgi:hypothetical protein